MFRSIVYYRICCNIGLVMIRFLNHQISKGIITNFLTIDKIGEIKLLTHTNNVSDYFNNLVTIKICFPFEG